MTNFQWVVEEGGGIRKGFLEEVAFRLGHAGPAGLNAQTVREEGPLRPERLRTQGHRRVM